MANYLRYPFTPERLSAKEFKDNPESQQYFTPALMEKCTIITNTVYNWGKKGQMEFKEKGAEAAKNFMYLFHGKKAVRLVEKWIEIGYMLGDADGSHWEK